MDNLKPCPFCGGEAAIREFDDGSGGIRCSRCDSTPLTHASFGREKSKQAAIEEWNRRPDRWIPVSERLPEHPKDVLIWIKNAGTYIGYYNNLDEYKCWMMDAGKKVINVTHWMPLPEPPEQEVR